VILLRERKKHRLFFIAVGMNNYTLYMSRSLGKRDLLRLTSSTDVSTLGAALATMNASIQYGVSCVNDSQNK
jgi:hypothetical protein